MLSGVTPKLLFEDASFEHSDTMVTMADDMPFDAADATVVTDLVVAFIMGDGQPVFRHESILLPGVVQEVGEA